MGSARIQFRAVDDLEQDLQVRSHVPDDKGDLSEVARRDLNRYYRAVGATLYHLNLSYGEAMLVVDALNGYLMTPEVPYLMVHNVADAIQMDGLDTKWSVDGKAFLEHLSHLSPLECLALNDAVERWWNAASYYVSEEEETFEQRCIRVGLIRAKRNSSLVPKG